MQPPYIIICTHDTTVVLLESMFGCFACTLDKCTMTKDLVHCITVCSHIFVVCQLKDTQSLVCAVQ